MMNRKSFSFFLILAVSLLSGCATLKPKIAVDNTFWDQKSQVVGVVVAKSPKPTHHMTGSMGLLDIAVNIGNAKELIAHLEAQQPPAIELTAEQFVDELKKRNIIARVIEKELDIEKLPKLNKSKKGDAHYASRDFSSIASKHKVDKVLLLSVTQVGTTRDYFGFIPATDPQGTCSINGQLIDAKTSQLLWNTTETVNTKSEDKWDSPPEFPGLTKAMHRSIKDALNQLDANFFKPVVNVARK